MTVKQLRELLHSFRKTDDECEIVMMVEGLDIPVVTIQRNGETAGPGGIVRLVSKTGAIQLLPPNHLPTIPPSSLPFYIEMGPWPTPDASKSPEANRAIDETCPSYHQRQAGYGVAVNVATLSVLQGLIDNRRQSSDGVVGDSSISAERSSGGTPQMKPELAIDVAGVALPRLP